MDFAQNYGPAPNNFKVKFSDVLWNFVLSNTWWRTYLQTISKTWYMKFYHGDLFWCNIGVTFGSCLWHCWYKLCAYLNSYCISRKKKFTILVWEILFKYQLTYWKGCRATKWVLISVFDQMYDFWKLIECESRLRIWRY